MATLYAFVALRFYAGPRLAPAVVAYALRLAAVYALIALGLFLWSFDHASLLLGVATGLLAALFLGAVLRPERSGGAEAAPAPAPVQPITS
jgi:hypothetical protein